METNGVVAELVDARRSMPEDWKVGKISSGGRRSTYHAGSTPAIGYLEQNREEENNEYADVC